MRFLTVFVKYEICDGNDLRIEILENDLIKDEDSAK